MGYRVGHWSHYSECFACFPHGWVETLDEAAQACGVAGEDIPMFESSQDISPKIIDRNEARQALDGILRTIEALDAAHPGATGKAARAWVAAAREPDHARRLVLLRSADALGPCMRWTATERLSRVVRAVTALP
jgi:phytoene dehydrogenase-like protein